MDIKLPELGEGIESGDVLSILVSEGDTVEKDQGLIELETDKASVEIPSSHAGKISKIHVSEGDTLNIGGVIVSLETSDAKAEAPSAPSEEPPLAVSQVEEQDEPEPAREVPQKTSSNNETKNSDEPKKQEQPKPQPRETPRPTAVKESAPTPAASDDNGTLVAAGPAMRRFAREVGVDLRSVTGTGPGERITRADVLRVVREGTKPSDTSTATQTVDDDSDLRLTVPTPADDALDTNGAKSPATSDRTRDDWGPIRIEKMAKIRQTISRKMHESWTTIPRVTNFDDADVTELEQVRQASKTDYASAGIKLTQMPFVIKACAMALRANPIINASIDPENGQIIYKEYVSIGIAIDTERGLVVPSLRNVDKLAIPEIARELSTLADNIRLGKFGVEDLRGSTFTISNLGAIGGTYSTPIINPPEVAILLLGRSRKMPVVVDHQFAVRLQMPLSLSYDHRLVDGAAAARFLNDVKSFLQSPSRLLLAP